MDVAHLNPSPVVCPAFVCRVAGLPASAVLDLGDGELSHLLDSQMAVEETLACERDSLSAQLFDAIGGVADPHVRSKLLGLRRSLYNYRRPSADQVDAVLALPADVRAAVEAAQDRVNIRDALLGRLQQSHDDTLVLGRHRLRATLADADFQKGLALSSSTLFDSLPRYLSAPASISNSRTEHVERGLLRYLTRMATKATPFGTFCAVIGGEFVEAVPGAPLLAFGGDPRTKRSVVRLNKRLYAILWEHLCSRPAVRGQVAVELNPSLRAEGDRLLFLTGRYDREVFQRVPASETLDVVLELAGQNGGRPFADLATALTRDPRFDADLEEARAFLDKLIEFGMLRLRGVVAEQEADWSRPLCLFLAGIHEDPHAQAVVQLLVDLDSLAARYSAVPANDRASALKDISARLREGFAALDQPGWSVPAPALYEDATADSRLKVAMTPELQHALERLAEWAAFILPLNGSRLEMAPMRHFLDHRYASESGPRFIPLLTFYEDYYREHFREHLEKSNAGRISGAATDYDAGNPFGQECIRSLRAAWVELTEGVRAAWSAQPDAPEITIRRGLLESARATAEAQSSVAERSTAVFGQIYRDERGEVRILAQGGRLYGGFGKYFSRFLYLLPDHWRETAQRDNARLATSLLAEICGDAAFNANLHPPLLPWEISYPTGQSAGSARQIPSSELEVAPHPKDPHALILRHTVSGRRVVPIDLGFLNPFMRPPLYQLLSRFSGAGAFVFPLPSAPDAAVPNEQRRLEPRILYRPRITYEGVVVLARRSWLVPHTLYPRQGSSESNSEYFLRVNRWQREHGIPTRVYVKVLPLHTRKASTPDARTVSEESSPEERQQRDPDMGVASDPEAATTQENAAPHPQNQRYSRNFRKPQFIDFSNPLLVRLFARLGGALDKFNLSFEECLPTIEQLPVGPTGPHVVELVMQIGFPASSESDQ